MPRHLPAVVVFLALVADGLAYAQAYAPGPGAGSESPSPIGLMGAGIQGVVRDESGQVVSGVSILALGATLSAVRTDSRGRFLLLLAPGEYILRAAREGYLSTVRESVRVRTQPVERDITLTRVPHPDEEAALPAEERATLDESDHSHSELAWRLRHMPRSVLRDRGAVLFPAEDRERFPSGNVAGGASLFDWVIESSARAASSFFADTDFDGRVDLLTTSMVSRRVDDVPLTWPRGVASVLVGAQVGAHGHWSVRAAMAADERASWTLLGDYTSHPDRPHAFRLGLAMSSQDSMTARAALPSIAAAGSRRVGSAYLFDRWSLRPDVTVDYGVRVDRYDYLAEAGLVSPSAGLTLVLAPDLTVSARASRRLLAPGAAEFLPPSSSGPWLPPQRTFSTLGSDTPLRPEAVARYDLGVGYAIRWPRQTVLTISRRLESIEGQIATLFGLDATSEVGHYYVTTAGSPHLEAWTMGARTDLGSHARAALTYTTGQTRWSEASAEVSLPSGIQPVTGWVHDVTVSFDGQLPRTSTALGLAYRLNSHLLRQDRSDRPAAGGRFNLQVRQPLPYRPVGGGRLDIVLGVRTLLGELGDDGSFFDELLTLAPPTRLVCGL